jgi:hypothetical protein
MILRNRGNAVAARPFHSLIVLSLFCIYLVCICWHTEDNLLSYDEEHISGRESAADIGEAKGKGHTVWQIVINLDQFKLYVYKDHMPMRIYPCSGGKPETPSPTGDFTIISKDQWGEGFGGAWLGLSVPWGSYGIHGTKYPWIIGKKHASKGCIRLLTKNAKELCQMIPIGAPVKIIQDKRPFREIKNGDIGPDVRDTQIALKSLGYYDGAADGCYGKRLAAAVFYFQMDNAMDATGKVNHATYKKLMKLWKEGEDNN